MSEDEEIFKEAEAVKKDLAKLKSEALKMKKELEDLMKQQELNEETKKMKSLLEKQNKLLDLQIRETKTELEIAEYKKKARLPKTSVDARLKVIHEVREQILERRRELETEKTGLDPNPKFLGKSENHTEDVYELYVKCLECSKIFKTFKGNQGQRLCSSRCREQWVKKNEKDRPLAQEEWIERNCESWNWERVDSEKTETLGEYGIFKKVFRDPK